MWFFCKKPTLNKSSCRHWLESVLCEPVELIRTVSELRMNAFLKGGRKHYPRLFLLFYYILLHGDLRTRI